MTKIIVNADDFGYSKGVNLGIIEAHQEGIVSSTTLMTNMPGVEHAVELARKNEQLGVGIHFVLDCGSPVNSNVPSLVDENGRFLKSDQLIKSAKPEEIKMELTSQIEKFFSFKRTPTHIDSHHHIHRHKKVFSVVRELAEKYQLPIRRMSAKSDASLNYEGLKTVDYFNDDFYGDELDVNSLKTILRKTKKYSTVEIMTHPAFIDDPILIGSSYNIQRVKELGILTDLEIKRYSRENNLTMATYKDI